MPKHNSKKFIDKRKSVSFQLVQRSQQDPLAADDTAPQNVLRPVYKGQMRRLDDQERSIFDGDEDSMMHLKDPNDRMMAWPEGIEESLVERMAKVQAELPKEVFPSMEEEPVGLLNKGTESSGLQLSLDPEVRETLIAMEDDFDFTNPENNLDDNFVAMADGVRSDDDDDDDDGEHDKGSGNEVDIDSDDLFPDPDDEPEFKNKKKSYYSMISHVTRTPLLDLEEAKFQRLYDEEYAEGRHRPNTEYTSKGTMSEQATFDMLYAEIDKLEKEKEGYKYAPPKDQELKERTLQLYNRKAAESSSDSDDESETSEEEEKVEEKKEPKYVSKGMWPPSLKPKKAKIQVSQKTGIPINVLGMNKLTTKALDQFNSNYEDDRGRADDLKSMKSRISELSFRDKNETADQKRHRKTMVKMIQAERRAEKKANSQAFRDTAQKQHKVELNTKKNKAIRGLT